MELESSLKGKGKPECGILSDYSPRLLAQGLLLYCLQMLVLSARELSFQTWKVIL